MACDAFSANNPVWLYDEFHFSGVDYSDKATTEKFEKRHRQFRDFDLEFQRICERTGLSPDDVVLDVGCGSGAFVLPASKYCRKVYAADVSNSMLEILQEKLDAEGIKTVELLHAGFLTTPRLKEPLDVVISSIALHHLPDFWKIVALQKIADALKPNGVFYLLDVVFAFPVEKWREGVQNTLDSMESAAGREAKAHISAEYSTFDWVLEGAFERVGLKIEAVYDDAPFLRAYVCRKVAKEAEEIVKAPESLVVTREQACEIDARATERLRVPSLLLMENAGRSLADVFVANAARLDSGKTPRRVLICCGKGNNGGDGFVLFRRLEALGFDCRIVAIGAPDEYRGDARVNLDVARAIVGKNKEKLFFWQEDAAPLERLARELDRCDWAVDALLGTGASDALRAPYDAIVAQINRSKKPVYAVDVPSGLDCNDGTVVSDAIRARLTTTLAAKKIGLTLEKAREYVGELRVGDIGVDVAPLLENDER